MIDHHPNRSGGWILVSVCDRVMIRRQGGELLLPFPGSRSPSCSGCSNSDSGSAWSNSGPGGSNVFPSRLGMTLSWYRLWRALPLWISTKYDRGASAFPTTTLGVGLLLSVVIQTSVCCGICKEWVDLVTLVKIGLWWDLNSWSCSRNACRCVHVDFSCS